jgi:hypothetical protein
VQQESLLQIRDDGNALNYRKLPYDPTTRQVALKEEGIQDFEQIN